MIQENQKLFEEFVQKEGRRAELILSNLGKKKAFVDAIGTELGQELLRDVLRIAEGKLEKIINDKANTMDKATFKVCRMLAGKWVERVNSYNHGMNKVFNRS